MDLPRGLRRRGGAEAKNFNALLKREEARLQYVEQHLRPLREKAIQVRHDQHPMPPVILALWCVHINSTRGWPSESLNHPVGCLACATRLVMVNLFLEYVAFAQ
jgi:hypothetical protein